EVALSFVLLVGAGLMLRSFMTLQRVDPGFRADGVLKFHMPLNTVHKTDEQAAAYVRDTRDRLAALPGVKGVSAANTLPLEGFSPLARWGTAAALSDPNR